MTAEYAIAVSIVLLSSLELWTFHFCLSGCLTKPLFRNLIYEQSASQVFFFLIKWFQHFSLSAAFWHLVDLVPALNNHHVYRRRTTRRRLKEVNLYSSLCCQLFLMTSYEMDVYQLKESYLLTIPSTSSSNNTNLNWFGEHGWGPAHAYYLAAKLYLIDKVYEGESI